MQLLPNFTGEDATNLIQDFSLEETKKETIVVTYALLARVRLN